MIPLLAVMIYDAVFVPKLDHFARTIYLLPSQQVLETAFEMNLLVYF